VTNRLLRPSNSTFRSRVGARDCGVCALCGLDTEDLARRYDDASALDRAALQKYQCNNCDDVGTARPCAECGSRLQRTVESVENRAAITCEATRRGFKALEFHRLVNERRSLWVADHTMPLDDGGEDDPDTNGRTLCVPCNHRVTADQARRRAKGRRVMRGRNDNIAREIRRAMKGLK
jgi:hypothetical protein